MHRCLLVSEAIGKLEGAARQVIQFTVVRNSGNIILVRFPSQLLYASYVLFFLGKEVGEKMVLRDFLKLHKGVLPAEYMALSPEEKRRLLSDYRLTKEEGINVPKRASNVALTKAVYSKIQRVTATVSVRTNFLMHF
jgi:hypothetical protein